MARFYVEKNGEWNIFSTVVDDFILDEFVCLDALKARLLYERYKELTEDIDSLMTDRPRVNVMSYAEATERMRKDEPQTDELQFAKQCHKPSSLYYRCYCDERKEDEYCNGCRFWYESQTEKPLVCDGDCWMKREFGEWLCEECEKTPQPKKYLPDYSYEAGMAKRLKQMSYNVDAEEREDGIRVTVHKEEPQAERNSE